MTNLRKLLLVMAALILTAGAAEAKILRFGIKGGLNVNSMGINNAAEKILDPDNNCGWHAGVMAEVQVPIIGICADVSVMYSRLNNHLDRIHIVDANENYATPSNFGKNFLEIPVHLKYKFNLPVVSNVFTPFLLTGPSFALNLNKKTFEDIQNRKCQTSWDFGVGFELFSHLQLQGAYCLGMNNLAKHWDAINEVSGIKVKNNYWTVSAAWLF